MGLISAAVILLIAIFSLGLVTKSKYSEIQTLNMAINEKQMRVDHLNRSGGSLTFSTCTAKQQSPTSVYSDQQERRGMAERLHDSNGVLNDDRIRNTVIENHRRTTAAITATTNAVAAATAEFRRDAKQNYPSLISTIKDNGERQKDLVQTQKSLATTQKQFHELERSTATYTEQINGKVREMSQITANNEDVLEKISTVQRSVSSQVAKAQQNLLETSELLKRISSK
jgi:uncharacterized membrane protein YdfJ with MMPL/SSD domain